MQFSALFLPKSALSALLGSFTYISLLTLVIKVLLLSHTLGTFMLGLVGPPLLLLLEYFISLHVKLLKQPIMKFDVYRMFGNNMLN